MNEWWWWWDIVCCTYMHQSLNRNANSNRVRAASAWRCNPLLLQQRKALVQWVRPMIPTQNDANTRLSTWQLYSRPFPSCSFTSTETQAPPPPPFSLSLWNQCLWRPLPNKSSNFNTTVFTFGNTTDHNRHGRLFQSRLPEADFRLPEADVSWLRVWLPSVVSSCAWYSATYSCLSITFGMGLISVASSCSILWSENLSS